MGPAVDFAAGLEPDNAEAALHGIALRHIKAGDVTGFLQAVEGVELDATAKNRAMVAAASLNSGNSGEKSMEWLLANSAPEFAEQNVTAVMERWVGTRWIGTRPRDAMDWIEEVADSRIKGAALRGYVGGLEIRGERRDMTRARAVAAEIADTSIRLELLDLIERGSGRRIPDYDDGEDTDL